MILRGIFRIGYLKLHPKTSQSVREKFKGQVKRRSSKGEHFRREKRKSGLGSMHIKMFMANQASHSEYFNTYSDGLPFIIDNSATGAICNERLLFIGMFETVLITLETAHGAQTKEQKVGTIKLKLVDDTGQECAYCLFGVKRSF